MTDKVDVSAAAEEVDAEVGKSAGRLQSVPQALGLNLPFLDQLLPDRMQGSPILRKAVEGWFVDLMEDEGLMQKAIEVHNKARKAELLRPRALGMDPYNILPGGIQGYQEKGSPLSWAMLRRMGKTELPEMIKRLRVRQMSQFTRILSAEQPGFGVRLKDIERRPSEDEKKEMKTLARWLETIFYAHPFDRKPNMTKFFSIWIRDHFDIDQVCAEIVRTRNREKIAKVCAVDAATIRPVIPAEYYASAPGRFTHDDRFNRINIDRFNNNTKFNDQTGWSMQAPWPPEVVCLQVIAQTREMIPFTEEEMIREYMNPQSELRFSMYGYSVNETAIRIITGLVSQLTYNIAEFTSNRVPPGVMTLIGKGYDEIQLNAFKRMLWAQLNGAAKRWRLPVIQMDEGEGVNWVPFNLSSRDKEYHPFWSLLLNIYCALCGIYAEELGFESYRMRTSTTIGNEPNPVEKIASSQDQGLVPLLNYFASIINQHVMSVVTDKYVFAWSGIDVTDRKERLEIAEKEVQTFKGMNELRAEEDLKPFYLDEKNIPEGVDKGSVIVVKDPMDLPLNQMVHQAFAQKQMREEEEMRQGAEAAFGPEAGGPGFGEGQESPPAGPEGGEGTPPAEPGGEPELEKSQRPPAGRITLRIHRDGR